MRLLESEREWGDHCHFCGQVVWLSSKVVSNFTGKPLMFNPTGERHHCPYGRKA
jgi:hypothetical protein